MFLDSRFRGNDEKDSMSSLPVIPGLTGNPEIYLRSWIPVFTGMTTF